jgi:signal transduction histidine kinase
MTGPAGRARRLDDVPSGTSPDAPGRTGDSSVPDVLKVMARREHSLLSLMELSQELNFSLDLYGIADLALFNLMGQLGTSKAALWIAPKEDGHGLVLLRSPGISKHRARAVGSLCDLPLINSVFEGEEAVLLSDLEASLPAHAVRLAGQAGIALFAPVHARGKFVAMIALGERIGGEPYGQVELQILQASLGMVGVALENTALYNRLQEQHRQLQVANQELKELDKLKAEFLRNVNHELCTPLTVIIAYLQVLEEMEDVEGRRRDFLRTALAEGKRLQGLIERLLDFSSLTAENADIRRAPADLVEFLSSYHRDRQPGVVESLREFTLALKEDRLEVQFDAHRVLQVMDVLVDNAIKFTTAGCHIELRLGRAIAEAQGWARIEVVDDGPGIPPDRMHVLFKPFQQVDGSMTRSTGGMGVGLAFARSLAERMGGMLTAESRIDAGSTFSLYLPLD